MSNHITHMAGNGVPVRAAFALAVLWLLASFNMFANGSGGLSNQVSFAMYGVAGGALIVLAGLAIQKVLESAAE